MNDYETSSSYPEQFMGEWITSFYRVHGMEAHPFNFHSHYEYEIYLFHSGNCRYLINNRIYDLQPGDIILLDGMTLHKPNPQPGSTYIRSMIHFSPLWLQELLAILGMPNLLDPFQKLNNCLLRTGYDEAGICVDEGIKRISSLISYLGAELQQTGKKSDTSEGEIKLELVQLLVRIYKMSHTALAQHSSKRTEKEHHAEGIASWINEHYTEKVSLDRLADEMNLSKSYASHVFKEVTGFTVMEYVMGCRFNQVKYLLEMEPGQTLGEVSRASGFESIAHFSRFFKEKSGMTPSQYRKKRLNIGIS
ncbi:AraC family transcriptional regulator [Peribacillus sp. SI8-4]|uniref:AraC family transcriptional regulator n=1 Tax=Peribacillus sp. SI8-4 TaxID=3048009 RepID=UPI0025548D61|nr:AraC family transcriptional regulator [Peribacillus sp. SI8-4]